MTDKAGKTTVIRRGSRVVIGMLLPVLFCAVGAMLFGAFRWIYLLVSGDLSAGTSTEFSGFFTFVSMLLIFGYALMGVQSFIYALLMEFVVNPHTSKDYMAVLVSGVLGALCGLSLLLMDFPATGGIVVYGFIDGAFVGAILRYNFSRSIAAAEAGRN